MTQPVHWWPARLPAASGGVFVIGVEGDGEREAARAHIRAALREALGQLTSLAPQDVLIQSAPGRAPTVTLRDRDAEVDVSAGAQQRALPTAGTLAQTGHRTPRTCAHAAPGIAISHDGPLSLAAINLAGPVGIDLMQVQAIDDWRTVARDYLGPAVTRALDAAVPGERPLAFAHAWTEREARLKCLRLQLGEWNEEAAQREARCRCVALALPPGFAGTLAIP